MTVIGEKRMCVLCKYQWMYFVNTAWTMSEGEAPTPPAGCKVAVAGTCLVSAICQQPKLLITQVFTHSFSLLASVFENVCTQNCSYR